MQILQFKVNGGKKNKERKKAKVFFDPTKINKTT